MHPQAERTPLADVIAAEIAGSARTGETPEGERKRCLTFRDYMELCLYEPEHGYYRSGAGARVGREGDFYTSAYIGDAMGERLGHYLYRLAARRFEGAERVELVDWGGGTGRLAAQMLAGWKAARQEAEAQGEKAGGTAGGTACEAVPASVAKGAMGPAAVRLTVVDGHPGHRREAEALLAPSIRAGEARVMATEDAEAWDWRAGPVIVVANELLDAMPVHRVCRRDGRLAEWGVAWNDADGRPEPCLTEPSDPRLAERLAQTGMRLREGQSAEVGLDGADWVAAMAGKLGEEAILALIDYGDEAMELTAEHRMDGTLLCYRRHIAHADPFAAPGEQDMTAHVNFTLIELAAAEAGWSRLWYGTQRRFLVEAGLLERLVAHSHADPFHPEAKRNRAIRQLLLSDGMSELFKVLVLER